MFDTILIANRGEIAVRVIRTARRMGVRTIAVYSDADAGSLHVRLADDAVRIGPPAAAESYLRGDAVIAAALATGAQAIHPGYGFLAENAAFASACARAGLVFIGPPVDAIRIMGSKSESKRALEHADVPLVPGYHGDAQDLDTLQREADRIGFPILVKASAGGGGKGMRVVASRDELADAVRSAQREAKAAFGDDRMLLERYLDRPRHVEIQVFGDTHGQCVYLFERDCSLQRRHQKVIEEAPAPGLAADVRRRMGEAAVAAAQAVHYVGAGTVEFLYSRGEFHFIEMNTRLQVEHPVTEFITGLDLVEWQLRVASGERLPLRQDQLVARGHAFEARLYAEDTDREFLPAIGRLAHLRAPESSPHVRVDTGVRSGDDISPYYDPMIAKLVVWDEDRASALRRLRRALADYEIAGVVTNRDFLSRIAAHPAFAAADVDTGFIGRHLDELTRREAPSTIQLGLAALASLHRSGLDTTASTASPSPWATIDGFRLNGTGAHAVRIRVGDDIREVVLRFRADGFDLSDAGRIVEIRNVRVSPDRIDAVFDGHHRHAAALWRDGRLTIVTGESTWIVEFEDPSVVSDKAGAGSGRILAPMPGAVLVVHVRDGDVVVKGQPLLVLEAMKMEHTLRAPVDGRVARVLCGVGDRVSEGDELLAIEPSELPSAVTRT